MGIGVSRIINWILVVVGLLVIIAVGYFGYERISKSSEQEASLRAEFAELKVSARSRGGIERAKKLKEEGNLDAAIAILENEVASSDKSISSHILLGDIYLKRGRRHDAMFQYERALESDPANKEVLEKQVAMLLADGRETSAVSRLKQLVVLDPNDLDTRYKLADLQYQVKEYAGAYDNYSKIVALKGEDPGALQGMAHISLYRNSPSEALAYYERAVAGDPGLAESWYFIARIKLFDQDFEGAIPALRKAINLSYQFDDLRLYLATALEYSGKTKEAIAEYKRFIAEHPNHPKIESIKFHVSQLEFWEAPPHADSRNLPIESKPWGDSILPDSRENRGFGGARR